uniref:Uncharacterized protein n=2 Tax=viral metagenome TaxID=1070528 RepID=A0A6M3JGN9_9ZZZZ
MKPEVREALEEMVWQFAYRGVQDGKPILYTGGLSALESAFAALGWSDPKTFDDMDSICDIVGCMNWVSVQGGVWDGGYWMVCSTHHREYLGGKPRPEMKQRAIDREISRGRYKVF